MHVKFLDVCKDVTKTACKIPQREYLSNGKYKIFDQSQKYIGGYSDLEEGVAVDYPYIVFGDHTRVVKFIEEPCFIGADGVKLLKVVNEEFLPKYIYYAMLAKPVEHQGYSRHFKLVKELYFEKVDKRKQQKIIDELEKIEWCIKLKNEQLADLDELVKSRFVELFGNLHDNKNGFDVVTIEEVCSLIKDGTHQTPQYTEDKEAGYKFLSSKDVMSQKIDWTDIKYIPAELHEKLYATIKPQRNDILMSKNGVNYGVAAVNDTDEVFDIYVSLALLRPKEIIDPVFFRCVINNPETKRQFDSSIKGIGVPNLHLGEIKKTKIILPPIELQGEFVAFVTQVDKSKVIIQKQIVDLQELLDSKMDEYFS